MNKCSFYISWSCCKKTLPGLRPLFYFPCSRNATYVLSRNLVCKELNSVICLCWWNIKNYLFCIMSYLNGQLCYGQICCQLSGWNIKLLVFCIMSWLNGQLDYEQSMWDRCTFKKLWLHFILPPCAYYYYLVDMINSYPCDPLAPAHFNE